MSKQIDILRACDHPDKDCEVSSLNIHVCCACWNAGCAAAKAERAANRKPRTKRPIEYRGATGDYNLFVALLHSVSAGNLPNA